MYSAICCNILARGVHISRWRPLILKNTVAGNRPLANADTHIQKRTCRHRKDSFCLDHPKKIPVPTAPAPTERKPTALPAFLRLVLALFDKAELFPLPVDLFQGVGQEITQLIVIQHVKITGIDTSIRFDHILQATLTSHCTDLRRLSIQNQQKIIKVLVELPRSFLDLLVPKIKGIL